MSDFVGPSIVIEPNPLSFGQVPQKDVRVRVARLTNRHPGPVTVSIDGKSPLDVPADQPPSGFFWNALEAEIPFKGSREFPVDFMPRAADRFRGKIEVHVLPKDELTGDTLEIELSGTGLPDEIQPQ